MGQRAECNYGGFTATRISGDATDRSIGDHQLILRIIPGGFRINGIPQQFEGKAAPTSEQIFHILGNGTLFEAVVVQVDIEGAVGIAAFRGPQLIAVFPHGDTVTPEPYFTPIGHSMPINFSEEQLQKTKESVEKAVQALGLRDCVANVDLMFVDGEPKLIELGARVTSARVGNPLGANRLISAGDWYEMRVAATA